MNNNTRRKNNLKRRKIFFGALALIVIAIIVIIAINIVDNNEGKANTGVENSMANDFSKLYYYESDKQNRYKEYAASNPTMDAGDIVWHVNSGLDGEFYKDCLEYDDNDDLDDLLIIVNKYNKLPSTFAPNDLSDAGNGIQMRDEAATAYKKMSKEAKRADIDFIPQSGYRSYDYQNDLYENYKASDPEGADTYSARPGFSEHQTGLALDINIPSGGTLRNFVGTEQAEWVLQNAHKFGFIVRYTEENNDITGYISEPWHIRYIGTEHATAMYESGIISYEEYKVKFIDHAPKK